MAGSVLPDTLLRDLARQAGLLPPDSGRHHRIRLRPANGPGRGDLSTDAALVCARAVDRPAEALAVSLAAALREAPMVCGAASSGGHVNLTLADAALPGVIASLLESPPVAPEPIPLVMPIEAMWRRNWMFRVQYAHARCRSLARAAEAQGYPEVADWSADWGMLSAGEPRRLLCWLDHWWRIADAGADTAGEASVRWYLIHVSDQFDRVWKHPVDGAKLRALHAGEPSRGVADLRLALAAACVLRAGLDVLGVTAAEEIR